jgi:hypothetical protein
MKARELFGVGVRLMSVWFLSQAFHWSVWAYLKNAQTGLGNPAISAREDITYACLYLILGTALFVGCNALVVLAYGAPSTAETTKNPPPAE